MVARPLTRLSRPLTRGQLQSVSWEVWLCDWSVVTDPGGVDDETTEAVVGGSDVVERG